MGSKLTPIYPGEILLHEFMEPLGLSNADLAKSLALPEMVITGLVTGVLPITSGSALRLARYFDTTPELWMGLQVDYDLRMARNCYAEIIEKEVKPRI